MRPRDSPSGRHASLASSLSCPANGFVLHLREAARRFRSRDRGALRRWLPAYHARLGAACNDFSAKRLAASRQVQALVRELLSPSIYPEFSTSSPELLRRRPCVLAPSHHPSLGKSRDLKPRCGPRRGAIRNSRAPPAPRSVSQRPHPNVAPTQATVALPQPLGTTQERD